MRRVRWQAPVSTSPIDGSPVLRSRTDRHSMMHVFLRACVVVYSFPCGCRGKHAPEFTGQDSPSTHCFSIVSKERSIHLAPSESVRATWLEGVKQIFAAQKVAVAAKKASSGSASPGPVPASPQVCLTNRAAAVPISTVEQTAEGSSSNVLADGRMYKSLTLTNGVVSATPIFMWHDPADGKLGTLYHSSKEGDKTKSSDAAMPVAIIKDVFGQLHTMRSVELVMCVRRCQKALPAHSFTLVRSLLSAVLSRQADR
jgi:hypothetical protein